MGSDRYLEERAMAPQRLGEALARERRSKNTLRDERVDARLVVKDFEKAEEMVKELREIIATGDFKDAYSAGYEAGKWAGHYANSSD